MNIKKLSKEIDFLATAYHLNITHCDITGHTLMCRLTFSPQVYMQIYANGLTKKLNLALIINGFRMYGIDYEGGVRHEHPVEDPDIYVPLDKEIGLENQGLL